MATPLERLAELERERVTALASALVKIQQQVAEAIARVQQLDGAIFAYEEVLKQSDSKPTE
jgi:flagellar biosynthesis chaperone FliJ